MQTTSSLLIQLETDIANYLLDHLEKGDMTLTRASQIAKFVLANLPPNTTDEQIQHLLPKLDKEFIGLSGVINNFIKHYDEKQRAIGDIQNLLMEDSLKKSGENIKDYIHSKITDKDKLYE